MRLRLLSLLATACLLAHAGDAFAQEAPAFERAIGGTASVELDGSPSTDDRGSRRHRQQLMLSPYFLRPHGGEGVQRVVRLTLRYAGGSVSDGREGSEAKSSSSVARSGLLAGRRHTLARSGSFAAALMPIRSRRARSRASASGWSGRYPTGKAHSTRYVGVRGFEPPTSSSRTTHANRTALHPDGVGGKCKRGCEVATRRCTGEVEEAPL